MIRKRSHHTGIVLIAGFKFLNGLLLLIVGLGLLRLMHAEVATLFSKFLEGLHLNTDYHVLHALVLTVDALRPDTMLVMSLVTIAYGALLLVEGIGLWFERAWAGYLTVISTSLFIPFELYEVVKRITAVRVIVLLLNVVIVVYLIRQLKLHTMQTRRDPRLTVTHL
jgi:uncharacterized membrane protein (DUF2068 family)